MGLGKTVETLSLITSNKPVDAFFEVYEQYVDQKQLHRCSATLIVTPGTLISQWVSEIESKTTNLRAHVYRGLHKTELALTNLGSSDIVLTSYEVLASEVAHVSQPWKSLNLRHPKMVYPKLSPLVQVRWYRICLDEAQNGVASPATKRAQVACLLPRVFSWVISGTPVKKNINDLYGLLCFLGAPEICGNPALWRIASIHPSMFRSLLHPLTCRHTKLMVKNEFELPHQSRQTLLVDFTPVEHVNYEQIFQQLLEELGVQMDGSTTSGTPLPISDPKNFECMKKWLVRLRQTCSHPQAGAWSNRTLSAQVLTMDEVLHVMLKNAKLRASKVQRELWILLIEKGQIMDYMKEHEAALNLWITVSNESQYAAKRLLDESDERFPETNDKYFIHDTSPGSGSLADSVDNRLLLEISHKAVFFAACAFFQLKDMDNEKAYYDQAEKIRLQVCTLTLDEINLMISY